MKETNQKRNRSGFQIMAGLISMIKPLLGYMFLAVFMGSLGNLMATFITILGGFGLLTILGLYEGMALSFIFGTAVVFALFRGILRYAEQASNHYIAFKLLARIRHNIFHALRKLAPAKLDSSQKGNLISVITSDIELLEVFYAHTISPIAIAVITSFIMSVFIGSMNPALGVLAALLFILVGVVIPVINGRRGRGGGQEYRDSFGDLNTEVLDNLYGLEEILQYGQQESRLNSMQDKTEHLENIGSGLKKQENKQSISTDTVILAAGTIMAVMGGYFAIQGSMEIYEVILSVIAVMSSFGPVAALSALSNNLHHTLACGNRVLNLLEEEPAVMEVEKGTDRCSGDITCENITFSYVDEEVHEDVSMETIEKEFDYAFQKSMKKEPKRYPFVNVTEIPEALSAVMKNEIFNGFNLKLQENKIHGILGKSGCGKSTLLKLLMRFYDTEHGKIHYGKDVVNNINTSALRSNISYVTQETFLFQDTVENNIKIAWPDAARQDVIEAAKKASVHDFIMSLPKGYDTNLGEQGNEVSGGEKQRIGIARAFLHRSNIIFLDEPTSNIDSLNEGIILKSLEQEKGQKTIILVSHRKSTMGIADDVLAM